MNNMMGNKSSNEKSAFFEKMRSLLDSMKEYESTRYHEGEDETWDKISKQIQKGQKGNLGRIVKFSISIAASLLLLIGGGYGVYVSVLQDPSDVIYTQLNCVPIPGKTNSDIVLITADNNQLVVEQNGHVQYDEKGGVMINSKLMESLAQGGDVDNRDQYNQIIVPKGKRTNVIFADGSKIFVNSGSRVIYPVVFAKNRREIFVDGEVYLDVKHDKSRPFIVKTNTIDVRVLGTSFGICAYKDDQETTVVLVTGKVEVETKSKAKITLLPDDLVSVNESGFSKKKVDAYEYVCWTENLMMFNREPLDKVFGKLSRYYGREIIFSPEISKLPLTGKLDLREDLSAVIQLIAETMPIAVRQQNDSIVIELKQLIN